MISAIRPFAAKLAMVCQSPGGGLADGLQFSTGLIPLDDKVVDRRRRRRVRRSSIERRRLKLRHLSGRGDKIIDAPVREDVPIEKVDLVRLAQSRKARVLIEEVDVREILEKVAKQIARILISVCEQTPRVELEVDHRREFLDRLRHPLQHVVLESFDVDLDEIDAINARGRHEFVERRHPDLRRPPLTIADDVTVCRVVRERHLTRPAPHGCVDGLDIRGGVNLQITLKNRKDRRRWLECVDFSKL